MGVAEKYYLKNLFGWKPAQGVVMGGLRYPVPAGGAAACGRSNHNFHKVSLLALYLWEFVIAGRGAAAP